MRVAKTGEEKQLLWALRDMVIQSCTSTTRGEVGYDDPTPVNSGFVFCNAGAIRLLAEYGLVQIEYDAGDRNVSGLVHALAETARILKTGFYSETQ